MKALISVYDKSGVVEFGRKLTEAGFELVSTGGTYNTLAGEGGLPVQQVSEVTGSPEILDGRVKTLHPVIYGGLLARRDAPEHMDQLQGQGIGLIDLVAVNLYPFVATISQPSVTLEDALENIDIGGPSMLRAAAKNFPSVAVVVDPADYDWVAGKLADGGLSAEERRRLAAKAFSHVAVYDAAVAGYLAGPSAEPELPDNYPVGPDQDGRSALRRESPPARCPVHRFRPGFWRHCRRPSASRARAVLQQPDGRRRRLAHGPGFPRPNGGSVIKHANPCGLATDDDLRAAYLKAYEGDTVFGLRGHRRVQPPGDRRRRRGDGTGVLRGRGRAGLRAGSPGNPATEAQPAGSGHRAAGSDRQLPPSTTCVPSPAGCWCRPRTPLTRTRPIGKP